MRYQEPSEVSIYTKIILLIGVNYQCVYACRRFLLNNMQFFYNFCQMFIKLSYLFLYLRHAMTTVAKTVVYTLIALVTAFGIATAITSMTLCIPFEKLWQPDLQGRCVNINAYYLSAMALNIFFDLTIFILPIPTLWTLPCKLISYLCMRLDTDPRQYQKASEQVQWAYLEQGLCTYLSNTMALEIIANCQKRYHCKHLSLTNNGLIVRYSSLFVSSVPLPPETTNKKYRFDR